LAKRFSTLPRKSVIYVHAWEKEEMSYWERKYSFRGAIFPPSYRIFEREKFLFQWLKRNIKGKTLIEIGCYFPHSVIHLLNPSQFKYTYVGVDIVSDALRAAKKYIPEGMFVRCSLTSFPFKKESFDAILSLGVIHHLSGGDQKHSSIGKIFEDRRTVRAF
jgi:2-polyprenyl-3-methyl-5-hydroxy-6-metoxy-1,4-benzoquinol methylase